MWRQQPLLEELTEQVFDRDGSARDVNSDGLDWNGTTSVVESLLQEASSVSATDGDGHHLDVAAIGANGICQRARDTRSCHIVLSNVGNLFQSLKVFLCPEQDDTPFVELTFFPDDLLNASTATARLLDKLIHLSTIGHAGNFFLRYENASWQFGSTGPGTGVITTWHALQNAT